MIYEVSRPNRVLKGTIALPSSKSESNRALIIRALCKQPFEIKNISTAQDTQTLLLILTSTINHQPSTICDVGAAGTAMRFLTAYFAATPGTKTLTGSDRMKERPIRILVEALRGLGAEIEYAEKDGYPPLKINGMVLKGGEVEIDGSVSSQYISALLMIAPVLMKGLVIRFKGEIVSRPYINMTLRMMEHFRVYGVWQDNVLSVSKQEYHIKSDEGYAFEAEADWSAASYWYSMVALADEADLHIKGLKKVSLQGDAVARDLARFFGVHTEYTEEGVRLSKKTSFREHFGFNFSDCPDLAQTFAVLTSALGIPSLFNGLSTLRIKETDRVQALKDELEKAGTELRVVDDGTVMILPAKFKPGLVVKTYKDHRMAMAFAPLAMLAPVRIEDPEVVKKSYPSFWDDLRSLGFEVKPQH